MTILSFHSFVEADVNVCHSGRVLSEHEIDAIKSAKAIILPQGCSRTLYDLVGSHCPNFFPNYDAYFDYPGKLGQAELFEKHGVSHPKTAVFPDLATYRKGGGYGSFSYPFVLKFSWGGEGKNVFLIDSAKELLQAMNIAAAHEKEGRKGFLFQEYIPTGGRSLRVVVIGHSFYPYWRVAENPDSFYSNLSKGAAIDCESFPEKQQAAVFALQGFCRDTGINLAGFDFLFDTGDTDNTPMFLEINYCFRCRGLGGVDNYNRLLVEGVREWLEKVRG